MSLPRTLAALGAALLLPGAALPAQRASLPFDRIGQERGLANGSVNAIAQDRAGFLWLGTEDGLHRYDGAGFTVHRPVRGDTSSLADAWITKIVASRQGGLWIGTLNGGVQRLDHGRDGFRRYGTIAGDSSSLSASRVHALLETRDGIVWVGTPAGLDRLDPASGKVRRHALAPGGAADSANSVVSIAEDSLGRLWVGTQKGGLHHFDRLIERFSTLPVLRPGEVVNAILPGERGRLWVSIGDALLLVDPDASRIVQRIAAGGHAATPIAGLVSSLTEGSGGRIWLGTDEGLVDFDPATTTATLYRHDRRDPRSLGGDIVRAVFVDRGGVLWVGVESYGVSRHAASAVHFDLLRPDSGSSRGLSNGYIRGISQDRAGNVWIATQYGGLDRLDARTGEVRVYRRRPGVPGSLPSDNVWSFLEDHRGVAWVGLPTANGFGTLDVRTGEYRPSPLVPENVPVSLLYETRDGSLLVGSTGRGLFEIDRDRRTTRHYTSGADSPGRLATNDVQTVLEDREGMLWVGGDGGVTRLDRRSGRSMHFRTIPGLPGSLDGFFATNVVEDRNGDIWIASKGAGLTRFERRTGTFTSFGIADGLPSDFVYGVLEDARGQLWLSTDDGIARLDPRTRAVVRFGLEDGLQAREFNRRAFLRARDGTMYLGGINGVTVFRPDAMADPPPPPVASLLSIRIGDAPPRLATALTADSVLRLRHDRSSFAASFFAPDFSMPEKTAYAYRLEGIDRGWITAGARREASYANLAPGRYVFRVVAANAAGRWSSTGAGVTIVVEPPWWGTWWARIAGVLALAGAIVLGMRLRLRAIRRRSARLEQLVEAQTRDLVAAKTRLHEALLRERDAARELVEITAAVPGAVFQLREAPGGTRDFVFVSEGVATLFGDALGRRPEAADPRALMRILVGRLHPDDRLAVDQVLATSRLTLRPERADLRWTPHDDGEIHWLTVRAHPSRSQDGSTVWTGVVMDVTAERRAAAERAALEAKMLQAQKAESLGVLAGGIAHDFNNLMVGVLANAELLPLEVPLPESAAEMVQSIRASALRAAELTQQMLAYAGKGRLVVGRVELPVLVREMLALLRSAVPRTIAFDVQVDPTPAFVDADATQLRQLVMNLVTNASEAIGDRGGEVTVRIGRESVPQRALSLLHAAPDMPPEGPYVMLEVRDDGCGMEPAILNRIFDPFFTTKFTGRGLGLAALLGIVRAHRGGLQVVSAPGRGTRFRIYFPPAASVEPALPAAADAAPALPAGTTARVLLVDDEAQVRQGIERLLRRLGYEVSVAEDGAAACRLASADGAIDLVLLDLTMPVMDGPSTVRALRAAGVAAPVVLMSGYAEAEVASRGALSEADAYLKKPFGASELGEALRAQLERRRG